MNLTKVISSKIDEFGRLAIKFLRLGKSDVRECLEVSPYGIDSNPIKDMVALFSPTGENGKDVIVGYINKNRIADVGETRLFSTDANGVLKMYVHVKNNGTIEFGGNSDNLVRFSELQTGFDNLKTDLNTFISVFNAHVHPTPSGVSSPTATQGTVSAASISGAKINELKIL
jgi:hypothetical protein